MSLSEFFPDRDIRQKMHVTENLGYDITMGRDLLEKLGTIIDFKKGVMT